MRRSISARHELVVLCTKVRTVHGTNTKCNSEKVKTFINILKLWRRSSMGMHGTQMPAHLVRLLNGGRGLSHRGSCWNFDVGCRLGMLRLHRGVAWHRRLLSKLGSRYRDSAAGRCPLVCPRSCFPAPLVLLLLLVPCNVQGCSDLHTSKDMSKILCRSALQPPMNSEQPLT